MRKAEINRKTKETDISLCIDLDGSGRSDVKTGCGFMDHMLTLFAFHSGFDLTIKCTGDTEVDYHHSIEDIGIALGQAFYEALGDKKGITRYGYFILPMDEALILTAVDLSGRSHLNYEICGLTEKVGDFDTELVEEFWLGFIRNAKCSLHIKELNGKNTHHIIEGAFKCAARTLAQAVAIIPGAADKTQSTKGLIE